MFNVSAIVPELHDLIREYKGDKILRCPDGKLTVANTEYSLNPGKYIVVLEPVFKSEGNIHKRHLIIYNCKVDNVIADYVPVVDDNATIYRTKGDITVTCKGKEHIVASNVVFIRRDSAASGSMSGMVLSFTLFCLAFM